MYYDYAYAMEEVMGSMATSILMNAGSSLLSIVIYVFTSLSLYTIAKRRQISKPWLAWIPIGNCWILGSISDQYRYVAKGETKNKRKVLLILDIVNVVLAIALVVGLFVMLFNTIQSVIMFSVDEDEMLIQVMKSLGGMMAMLLPMVGISIAYSIIYYMALYDLYASCDPNNKVVYLVVSIFIGIAGAIFLFICRNKEGGMPPRRDLPPAPGQQGQYGQYSQQTQYQQGQQYQAPQNQAPQQPQYQAPYQAQYQAPYQVNYQAPYQAPQQPEPVRRTEELPQQDMAASPYSQWPDPYAPQHPEKTEDAPEQL